MRSDTVSGTASGAIPAPRRKQVALVIGSGSVQCAAALGMWKVLQREGIGIDLLVGCSGGSLYASVMALGNDVDTCERLTRELWTPALTTQRDLSSLLSAIMPRFFKFDGSFGMVSDKPLMKALDQLYGDKRFEDTAIPLRIAATDLHSGRMTTLSQEVCATRCAPASPFPISGSRGRSAGAGCWMVASPIRCRWTWPSAKART